MAEQEPDFSGWATKANVKCSDGLTIMADAFAHQDKMQVPLVWMHQHLSNDNLLGYAILEHRAFGTYTYGFFNDTPQGQRAKAQVKHKDINQLSIYANKLTKQGQSVMHGDIKEVSLVLAGANPEAYIDVVNLTHSEGSDDWTDGEAIMYMATELEHSAMPTKEETVAPTKTVDELALEHAATAGNKNAVDVINTMNDDQKTVLYALVGDALGDETGTEHSDIDNTIKEDVIKHVDERFTEMTNLFETAAATASAGPSDGRKHLTHAQMTAIIEDAKKPGNTLKDAVLAHTDQDYGINDINLLFPDAKTVADQPSFVSRRMAWVEAVISGTNHVPFSRIKSFAADITLDTARAKGYIKGAMKKEEFFAITRRITTPTTIYKKQKLDRDDILDVSDFDVVAWLKQEMRMMLDEEIARAILIGDGREVDDEDKVKEPSNTTDGAGIRSIAYDNTFYAVQNVIPTNTDGDDLVDAVMRAMISYKGSGSPTLYTTLPIVTGILLTKDKWGRRLYANRTDLAAAMGVANIVDVEPIESIDTIFAVIVNLTDYSVGTDQGGEVNYFDFFDIDFNQNKYLFETRLSGALTKPASAVVLMWAEGGTLVTPAEPAFNAATGVVTITAETGVVYSDASTGDTLAAGAQTALAASGDEITVLAQPAANYYFARDVDDEWTFTRA